MLAFFSLLVKLPIISHYFGQAERIFEHLEATKDGTGGRSAFACRAQAPFASCATPQTSDGASEPAKVALHFRFYR